MIAGFESRGDFRPGSKCAQWESVGDAFRSDKNIRHHPVMLDGKHFACAREPGLDFVGDEEDAVLVEDLLHFLEVVRGRNDYSALAHNRLGDEGGDITGSGETDHIFDRSGALAGHILPDRCATANGMRRARGQRPRPRHKDLRVSCAPRCRSR